MSLNLPYNWIRCDLSEVVNLNMGQSPSGKYTNTSGQGTPLVGGAADLGTNYPKAKRHTTNPTKISNIGDVILCIRATIGRTNIADQEYCLGRGVAGLSAKSIDPKLLRYFLKHSEADLLAKGTGTTFKQVSKSDLSTFPISVPPLNEQKRIVNKIESLTKLSRVIRESLEAMPPLLERLRQSVLAKAFRGDLTKEWRAKNPDVEPASKLLMRIRKERRKRWEEAELAKMKAKGKSPKNDKWKQKYKEPEPVDTEGLPDLPEGWCWAASAELVEPGADIIYGIIQPGPRVEGGVPYVRGKDIQNGKILVDQLWRTSHKIAERYKRASLKGGDVLLGIIRATKVAIVSEELTGGNITQGTARFRPSQVINTGFLALGLEAPQSQEWLHLHYRGIDMPGLNLRDVRKLPIALAPLKEQQEIELLIKAWEIQYTQIQQVVSHSGEAITKLDQSILAKAFRGELVPQDPNDEPASVLLERIKAEREAAAAKSKKGKKRASKKKVPTSESKAKEKAKKAASENGTKPPPIDEMPAEQIMAAFQKACAESTWSERDKLIKEVSKILGYKRTGAKIKKALLSQLKNALEVNLITENNGLISGVEA